MKLCLLKMKLVVISFFYLLHIIKAQSDSPCPHIFNYRIDGAGPLYGVISASAPTSFQGLLNLEVQISIGNLIGDTQGSIELMTPNSEVEQSITNPSRNNLDTQGSIELMTPNSEVEQTIQQNRRLLFKVNFPYWINIKPKITKITTNENIICVGEAISEDQVRKTTGKITTLNLKFRLQITRTSSNTNPGVQPRPPNTNFIVSNNPYPNVVPAVISPMENKPFFPENTVPTQSTNYNPSNFDNFNNIDKYFTTSSTTQRVPIQRPTSVITSSVLTSISSYCGIVTQTVQLIYGGEEYEKGINPWLAALYKQREGKPQFICGSTIISKKHVLSAGHCVNGVSAKRFHLALGRNDIYNWFEEGAEHRSLSDIHVHPDYEFGKPDADVAVLVMSKEIELSSAIAPACLWSQTDNLQQTVGTTGVVAGWGIDESGSISAKPKQITMPIVDEETCLRSAAEFHYVLSNRSFCAGFRNNTGPCNGDSGGGFYVEMNNRWFIRGIVSHALKTKNKTCDLSNYMVFADIAKHADWIMSNVT